jgi:hypothetical protein
MADITKSIAGYLTPEQQAALADTVFGGVEPGANAEVTIPESEKLPVLDTSTNIPARRTTVAEQQAGYIGRLRQQVQDAKENERLAFQDMLAKRRGDIEKQRTSDVRMAQFNALGNALRAIVQPLGWAAGGSTAGVQPNDDRQYLSAFSRVLQADNDIRNLGREEAAFDIRRMDRDVRHAENVADYERRRSERLQDYGRRVAENIARKGDDEKEKRKTIALRAYYDLIKSDSIHKGGYPSFRSFVTLGGFGNDLFGDGWNPTDDEVKAIVESLGGEDSIIAGRPERKAPAKSSGKGKSDKPAETKGKVGGFKNTKVGGFK